MSDDDGDREYEIELTIRHPSLDPKKWTRHLPALKPYKVVMAGDEILDSQGRPRGRKAYSSIWCARLHETERIRSTGDLSDCLRHQQDALNQVRDLIGEFNLNDNGEVTLEIACFNQTLHSVCVLDRSVIEMLGEAGISIAVSFFGESGSGANSDHPTDN